MGIEQIPDINKTREEIDKKNAEMEKKERERIEEEYKRLSEQEKPTEEPIEENLVEEKKEEIKEWNKSETKEPKEKIVEEKKEEHKEEKKEKGEKEKEKEILENEITENFYDELKKIKSMPDKTGGLKMEKTEKYFQLIENWQDLAYLDNYKGIKNIFSELDKLKPSIWFYDFKKAQITNNVAKSMALNYKEWKIEDKEKPKIIKNFVKEQSKGKNIFYSIFYSKDKTLKEIAKILASNDIPFKNNIDVIVKEIENPDIKAETIARMTDIERESIEKKKQSLHALKEDMKRDKLPPDKMIKEQLENLGIDPKVASEILSDTSEILKNPEVQKKIQELRSTIEKVTKKENGKEIPDAVKKVKKYIKDEKKESPWKTGFEATGGIIGLSLLFFIMLILKVENYLADKAGGKKIG